MANFGHEPILVTGAARSATSMIAGIIAACGAWGGRTSGPNQYNKKGMFENADIRNTIVKPFFDSMGVDRMGQNPLPDVGRCKELAPMKGPEVRDAVLRTIRGQGYSGDIRWYYKGAKLCLVWPIWKEAFPNATWVIVRRPDVDIVSSCMTTAFMRKREGRAGWQEWLDEHKKRFQEMADAEMNVTEVWSNEVAAGRFNAVRAVVENVGLVWDEGAVSAFVDPTLYVHNAGGVHAENH